MVLDQETIFTKQNILQSQCTKGIQIQAPNEACTEKGKRRKKMNIKKEAFGWTNP